jgi:hypothetical protein
MNLAFITKKYNRTGLVFSGDGISHIIITTPSGWNIRAENRYSFSDDYDDDDEGSAFKMRIKFENVIICVIRSYKKLNSYKNQYEMSNFLNMMMPQCYLYDETYIQIRRSWEYLSKQFKKLCYLAKINKTLIELFEKVKYNPGNSGYLESKTHYNDLKEIL